MSLSFRRILFFLIALTAVQAAAQTPEKSGPNVVLITVDTLRADHVGCYGYQQIKTPNIDALAADGVRFARAFTPVPVTLPSHSAMLTGTYPMLSGMHDFSGNKLSPQQVTLVANDFEQVNGYTLAIMVRGAEWGRALITRTPRLSGLIVSHDGELWISPGMEKLRFATPAPQAK